MLRGDWRFWGSRRTARLGAIPLLLLLFTGLLSADPSKTVILFESMSVPVVQDNSRYFLLHLHDLGYREDKNLKLILLNAQGDFTLAKELLGNALKHDTPDLVVTNATLASQTAYRLLKNSTVPILFMTVADPVGAGLIKEIGKPTGSNISGEVFTVDRNIKVNLCVRLASQKIDNRRIRIGYIHTSYPSSLGDLRELQKIAEIRKDIEFIDYAIPYQKDVARNQLIKEAIKGLKQIEARIDFLWEPTGPLGEMPAYTEALLSHTSIPILFGNRLSSVEAGALINLTPDHDSNGKKLALMADAVFHGTPAGTIPPTPPDAVTLGINIRTALEIGIVIPSDILELAGNNLFR